MNKRYIQFGPYLFLLPGVLFLVTFMVYPIIYNIIMSFQNVTLMNLNGEHSFIGLRNYTYVLQDSMFINSLKNSFVYTGFSLFFQFIIGFALALFFNKSFPGRNMMRSLFLLAWMMPVVIVGTLFKWILVGDSSGILNYVMMKLQLISEPVLWLSDFKYAMSGLILTNIWIGIPFNMVILLAGLQAVSRDLYEASEIDGAGKVSQFLHITMPGLRPTILILLMLGVIYTFKSFDLVIIMTGGGPVNSTTLLPYYAYQLAFELFEFSQGAAVASIIFVILMMLAIGYIKLSGKEEQN